MTELEKAGIFGLGQPNDGFAQFFIGQSYLNPVVTQGIGIFNVTFEPGCRNNWHIHHAKSGGGQILLCTSGRGWYQAEGEEPVSLTPGKAVYIPPEVTHWHGAARDSWFAHLAIEVPGKEGSNEWLEPVDESQYNILP
ncbi:cupin domain-containing protein [Dysosmobacter acutus]|nr:cupin domain-containing protein [Dysosmobacter acutus]